MAARATLIPTEEMLGDMFCVRSVPICYKQDELRQIFRCYARFGTYEKLKNGVFWDVTPCGSCKTDVSEEPSASFIRVTRIGEPGTTLAATSNRRTLRRYTNISLGISSQRASVASCS
jgi:hypothetical protein